MTLSEYRVQEIIAARSLVSQEKKDEFSRLFKEFLANYPNTPAGQSHMTMYSASRGTGQANLEAIQAAASQGRDVTDDVLLDAYPTWTSPANRSKGAWIHWAPTINGDLRHWLRESWVDHVKDWPRVADAILHLIQRCIEDSEQLSKATAEFAALPYSKGLQTGMLTPILDTVRPDDFTLINDRAACSGRLLCRSGVYPTAYGLSVNKSGSSSAGQGTWPADARAGHAHAPRRRPIRHVWPLAGGGEALWLSRYTLLEDRAR